MANVTFRNLSTYADGTPGATDRLLFETSGNLPRGVAPGTLLDAKLGNVSEDTNPALGGPLDCATFEVFGNRSPFQTMTGSQAAAPSGRSWKITGNATAVPITNGWFAKVVNTSGSPRIITPVAPGSCVLTKSATTQATATLGDDKSCVLHGDGTNLIVDGDVT